MPLTLPSIGGSWQTTSEVRPGLTVPVLRPRQPTSPNGFITTSSAAVSSSESFSVSMWVKPANVTSPNVQLLAQQRGNSSLFEVQLHEGKYRFCRWGTSAGSETWGLISSCVSAPSQAVTGEWTLVTGIWDRANQQLRLDIGSSPTPVVVTPNLRGSTESWTGGSGFTIAPLPADTRFSGLIANPVVVPGVLDSRQLGSLSQFASPFTS
nr:LamG-like jellyroll fold domain-containing protein [Microbacterium sp. CFBP 13617]